MTDTPHPDARALLDTLAELDLPPLHEVPVEAARRRQRANSLPGQDYEPEPVEAVETAVVRGAGHGVPVRAYAPGGTGRPVLVWAHGGGFVLGDVETEDSVARALCNAADCVVVSVDYRLAPEHPFPAALEDVVAVLEWARGGDGTVADLGGDSDRVAVGGASAGGNLAAAASLLGRDRGAPRANYQVLVYPAVSHGGEFDSRSTYDGYFLTREETAYFESCYLENDLHGRNPYAFPLGAEDLGGLPPATVVTAGFDPLRDEGVAYAEAMAADGVDVTRHHYEGMIHAFLGMLDEPEWAVAREAVASIGEDLRGHFDGSG